MFRSSPPWTGTGRSPQAKRTPRAEPARCWASRRTERIRRTRSPRCRPECRRLGRRLGSPPTRRTPAPGPRTRTGSRRAREAAVRGRSRAGLAPAAGRELSGDGLRALGPLQGGLPLPFTGDPLGGAPTRCRRATWPICTPPDEVRIHRPSNQQGLMSPASEAGSEIPWSVIPWSTRGEAGPQAPVGARPTGPPPHARPARIRAKKMSLAPAVATGWARA